MELNHHHHQSTSSSQLNLTESSCAVKHCHSHPPACSYPDLWLVGFKCRWLRVKKSIRFLSFWEDLDPTLSGAEPSVWIVCSSAAWSESRPGSQSQVGREFKWYFQNVDGWKRAEKVLCDSGQRVGWMFRLSLPVPLWLQPLSRRCFSSCSPVETFVPSVFPHFLGVKKYVFCVKKF